VSGDDADLGGGRRWRRRWLARAHGLF
jgi:hypothetical protein